MNQTLIYCNTKKRVEELEKIMTDKDFTVSVMHSEMDQLKRDVVMKQFRQGTIRILITTEFFKRFIDVQ
jgi:translation initiation factor 4A